MKLKILNGLIDILLLCILLSACGPTVVEQQKPKDNKEGEAILRMNRFLIKENVAKIKSYIERQNWKMTETGSGLWYDIYEKGKGEKCQKKDIATIKYSVELLDGTMCYNSDSLGQKKFLTDAGKVEAGLDEGILLMHKGDRARFILPPHLAYGSQGDEKCIPPNSVVIYDVQLTDIQKNPDK
jgi:FKBP-type peptidyl-prolyl cis-trans isomerase